VQRASPRPATLQQPSPLPALSPPSPTTTVSFGVTSWPGGRRIVGSWC